MSNKRWPLSVDSNLDSKFQLLTLSETPAVMWSMCNTGDIAEVYILNANSEQPHVDNSIFKIWYFWLVYSCVAIIPQWNEFEARLLSLHKGEAICFLVSSDMAQWSVGIRRRYFRQLWCFCGTNLSLYTKSTNGCPVSDYVVNFQISTYEGLVDIVYKRISTLNSS